jgi:DNA-directed RNA polymerase subunit RPC12/RpoP
LILLALAMSGLVDLILIGLLWVFILATLLQFSSGPLAGIRSRCPACSSELLQRVHVTHHWGRLGIYRCAGCGAGFREELDGTLSTMAPEA